MAVTNAGYPTSKLAMGGWQTVFCANKGSEAERERLEREERVCGQIPHTSADPIGWEAVKAQRGCGGVYESVKR